MISWLLGTCQKFIYVFHNVKNTNNSKQLIIDSLFMHDMKGERENNLLFHDLSAVGNMINFKMSSKKLKHIWLMQIFCWCMWCGYMLNG